MNIGVLHSGDLASVSPGGVSQYIEKIIKNKAKGDNITLFGTADTNKHYSLFTKYNENIDGMEYTFIPVNKNRRHPLSIFYFINFFILYITHKELLQNIDLFYAQRMEYVLPFLLIGRKRKVVMAVHGSGRYAYMFWGSFIGFLYQIFEGLAIKRANLAIVLLNRNQYGVPYYKDKYNKYKERIVYGKVPIDVNVFNKIDKIEIRKKYQLSDSDNVIIYFGRIENNPKRVLLFPDILKKLDREISNLRWIIIGSGNDKGDLKEKIKNYKLEDNFILKEHLDHGGELVDLINCSDISVICSQFEGICMSALESIACGVPVAATDVGDIKEYIKSNKNGFIIPNYSDEQVIDDMYIILKKFFTDSKSIELDDVYLKYESNFVMSELKTQLEKVMVE